MSNDSPYVSIIMPAYNSASTIAESIRSVGMQTYKNWELIIVDDGSNDFTGEIINSFKSNDPRIILLKLSKNGGLPNARNEGCRLARGEFIVFLDSDDLWSKEKLEKQLHFHAVNQGIEISHTDFQLFNEYGFIKRPFKYVVDLKRDKRGDIFPGICYKNPIGILTVMVKRTLLMEVNFFDSTLWTMEDHDLWVRIAKRGKDFGYVPQVLAYYRITPGSIVSKTGKYKKAYKVFIRKLLESNNLNASLVSRYYYRYFGTTYFKSANYKLSSLYFWKSIKLVPVDRIALLTYPYLIISLLKYYVHFRD